MKGRKKCSRMCACQTPRQGNPPHLNKQSSYILILVVLVLLLELPRLKTLWKTLTKRKAPAKSSKPRSLKPKSEKDCPYCQAGNTQRVPLPETSLTPYSQTKSKRGRKKKICTHNYFCSNPLCYYCTVAVPFHYSHIVEKNYQILHCICKY